MINDIIQIKCKEPILNYTQRAQEVIDIEIEGLKKIRNNLGNEFSEAIDIVLHCLKQSDKLVVTGVGKNLHIAQKISATLTSTGATSVVLNPLQAMHGDLGIFNKGDVLLTLSYSGESEELLVLMPIVKRMNVKIIAVTNSKDNALAHCSDVVIPINIGREACPFNMAPTTSTTATLAIGDAIAMVLVEARGLKKNDYARLHPGGAIGRTLLIRVSDIMRTGDCLAAVKSGAKVKDALMAMTKARAGSAGVVDNDNKVLGIFTDGDLRRNIAENIDLLNTPIKNVMTSSPITVREDQLAVDVLKIYEDHKIDDLLVIDKNSRLIGAVDIQDLPKLKIM